MGRVAPTLPSPAPAVARRARAGAAWAGWAVAALALAPVAGVVAVWIDPPVSGFGVPRHPSVAELLFEIGSDGERRMGPLPRTVLLALAVCPAALVLGTFFAWLGARARYPGRRWLGAAGLLPFALPSYLLAMTSRETFGRGGAIGGVLGVETFAGFFPAALVLVLSCTPYAQILVGAALARLSATEEEAARGLGAGAARRFVAIVLPRLKPALVSSFCLVLLYVVSDFGVVDILDCRVLTWGVHRAFRDQQLALGALHGFGLIALGLPLVAAALAVEGPSERRRTAAARPPRRERPGAALLTLAYSAHAFQIVLGVVLPALALIDWVLPAALRAEAWDQRPLDLLLWPTLTSAGIAVTVTALAVGLGLIAAAAAIGRGGRGRALELAVHAGNALPGVLIALGLFAAALMLGRAASTPMHDLLRQSGVLLAAGLAIRFLAQAFGATKAVLLRLDERVDEAARCLGAGAWRRLLRVRLPLIAPGLAASALLVAVAVVKELPVTLMLKPREWTPLSHQVYTSYDDGNLMQTGLAGAALGLVALGAQAALARWRRHV